MAQRVGAKRYTAEGDRRPDLRGVAPDCGDVLQVVRESTSLPHELLHR